jgi:quinolinate synthase
MCEFAKKTDASEFIIATEIGILHTLRKQNPAKRFHIVDDSVTCPNMRRGSAGLVLKALEGSAGLHVTVAGDVAERARSSLERMLELSR